MKKIAAILIVTGLWGCNEQPKTAAHVATVTEIAVPGDTLSQAEIKELDSLDIDFQFAGNFSAYSSEKNETPAGGGFISANVPKKVGSSFPKRGLYLVIDQKAFSRLDSSILGNKLYLVNTTDSLVELNVCDSRLDIVAEAINEKNEWAPVSFLYSSFCGNSYYTVVLDTAEYWSFDIPVFKGAVKTKLRYTLTIDSDHKISSNEITAYLNKGQFYPEKVKE